MRDAHDDRCRRTIGDGPCNCALAALYHREAAGFRGVPLVWRSRLAPIRSFFAEVVRLIRSKRYFITRGHR